jgi:hypothetical protein
MKLVAAALAITLMAASANAACRTSPNGSFDCLGRIGDDDDLTAKRRPQVDEDDDRSDYGRPRYYSDGTFGHSLGDGDEWKERYKGDQQGASRMNQPFPIILTVRITISVFEL